MPNWGTDLSFSWVYVQSLEANGAAAAAGLIEKGDYIIGMGNSSMIAMDFDFVLTVRIPMKRLFLYNQFNEYCDGRACRNRNRSALVLSITQPILANSKP
jgi:hypothetical protein